VRLWASKQMVPQSVLVGASFRSFIQMQLYDNIVGNYNHVLEVKPHMTI
jgi:hypothetical protein